MPIGLRQALATKRNVELRLSKARALLAAQELEVCHELGNSVQLIDWWYQLASTNFDRKTAAGQQLEASVKEYNQGNIPIDLVLRTQADLAAAEVGYFTALVKYNQSINDLRVRRGSLLDENNIHLTESDWTPDAFNDALRRAWARSYAAPAPKLDTEPPEFVSGGEGGGEPAAYLGLPVPPELGGIPPYEAPPPSPVPFDLQPVPATPPATPADPSRVE
jgi:hypothetical protein